MDAGQLLKQLDENWRAMGKNESGGVLRACAMTLIAVLDEDEDIVEAGETMAALMHEQPNRTIILRVAKDGSEVDGRATIQCWMPFGRRQQICCEEIQIDSPRAELGSAARVLNGLMVADLPVALWCKNPALAQTPELRPVLGLAGKVMLDTTLLMEAGKARESLDALKGPWKLADLAWSRITRWRETIAQVIQMERYTGVDEAEISWAGETMPPTVAYLGAWFADAFGWNGSTTKHLALRCIDPVMPKKRESRIREVRLRAQGREIVLKRPAGLGVGIDVEGLKAHAVFPVLTDAMLLREELAVFGGDEQFTRALVRFPEVAAQ